MPKIATVFGTLAAIVAAGAAVYPLIPSRNALAEQLVGTWTFADARETTGATTAVDARVDYMPNGWYSAVMDIDIRFHEFNLEVGCRVLENGTYDVVARTLNSNTSTRTASLRFLKQNGQFKDQDAAKALKIDCREAAETQLPRSESLDIVRLDAESLRVSGIDTARKRVEFTLKRVR